MRPALAPSRCRHGDGDSGERADVDQVDVVAAADGVGASQLLDARTALASASQRQPARLPAACCRMASRASPPAQLTTVPDVHQVQLQVAV